MGSLGDHCLLMHLMRNLGDSLPRANTDEIAGVVLTFPCSSSSALECTPCVNKENTDEMVVYNAHRSTGAFCCLLCSIEHIVVKNWMHRMWICRVRQVHCQGIGESTGGVVTGVHNMIGM